MALKIMIPSANQYEAAVVEELKFFLWRVWQRRQHIYLVNVVKHLHGGH